MACSAAKEGHAVTLIAPHSKKEEKEGVSVIPIIKPQNRLKRFFYTLKIYSLLKREDADIYHFHDPELIPIMFAFQKISRKKIIYDIHEYYKEAILSKRWIPMLIRKVIAQITWYIEIAASKSFDCIIAATEELANVYKPYAKRSEYILNYDFKEGIDFSFIDCELDIDIIHVGTLSSRRFEFLLKVAEFLYKKGNICHWCFVGIQKEYALDELKKINTDCHKYIQIIEKVPFEEVKKFYQRAKIGINYHPPEKQFLVAIPIKVFEYMKYGLTVVTSDLPPLHKYINNGVNGSIVYTNTVDAFSDEIEKIIKQNKYAETAMINKTAILENYNWESEAKRLLRIYETL